MGQEGHEEVEWQFDAVDVRPVERWLRRFAPPAQGDPSLSAAVAAPTEPWHVAVPPPGPVRTTVDRYFDTDDWRLHRAGYSFRIRRKGRRVEASLKALTPPADGLRRRVEMTEPIARDDPAALVGGEGPVARRVAAMGGRRALHRMLEVRTRRRVYVLTANGAPAAEIAVDQTSIPLANGQEPARLRRIEVEVVGEGPDVSGFVRDMREACGLQPAALSKFEAAVLATGLEPAAPLDFGATAVDPKSSVGEVAFAVLRGHFAAFLAKEPGTRLGEDTEELHDMRVATRRLRAGMSLFSNVLPVRVARLRGELGWVAGLLGAVRDLDVQLAQTAEWAQDLSIGGVSGSLEALRPVLEGQLADARRALIAGLDAPRYERLVSGMTALLRHGPLRRSPPARVPAVAAAPDLLSRRYRKVRSASRGLKRHSPAPAFHKLRIRCKRLRYAVEFFSPLCGEPATPLIKRLVTLQDLLGEHQDAVVAMDRLAELASTHGSSLPPETVFAMGRVAERYARRAQRLRNRLPKKMSSLQGRWKDLHRELGRRAPAPAPALATAPSRAQPPDRPADQLAARSAAPVPG